MGTLLLNRWLKSIDYNADEWDFYELPGRDAAAQDINDAIQATFNLGGTEKEVRSAGFKAMRKYCCLGACDSGAVWKLSKIMTELFPTQK